MSAQELVRFDESEITGMTRYAKAYSQSGFFRDANSIEKAFVAISAGAEIGVPPFAAITGISIIQGKPVIGSGILAGLVKSHPAYDYRVKQLDDDACVITFFQEGEEIGTSSFSMEDAKRAQLDSKDVWKKFRRNMLFARAISNGVAFYCPDVTNGRMYVEHELDDVPAPRPIASAKSASTETTPPLDTEVVVDVEPVTEADPETPLSAESPNPLEPETSASVTSPDSPVEVLAKVLKALKPDDRRVVKGRTTLLGIKWDKDTPAALVEAFAGDDDGLMKHLRVESEAQVEPTADTPDEFQEWVDQQVKDEKQRQTQLAKAGNYGVRA
jgi:hypothetical protein